LFAFRESGTQISPVAMSQPLCENCCSTLFATGYKRPSEGGRKAFAFCLWLLLWAFGCGKLLEGKRITEGKRIAKGKLLKEKNG
jgi:hypothetical protein